MFAPRRRMPGEMDKPDRPGMDEMTDYARRRRVQEEQERRRAQTQGQALATPRRTPPARGY